MFEIQQKDGSWKRGRTNKGFVDKHGDRHPRQWWRLSSEEEKQAAGVRFVPDPPKPARKPRVLPYDELRRREYPDMGDQLDALWKQLNYDRLSGKELIQDCDDLLGDILAVKAKYPKPDDEPVVKIVDNVVKEK